MLRFRSAQLLLNLGGSVENEDEDFYNYEEEQPPADGEERGRIATFLDNWLVGQSSSDEYSERWKREFRQRPSWCDADLCLQQINRGKASGNRWALYARSFIQKALYSLGTFVQFHAWSVILTMLIIFSFCCYGLQFVHIETDIVKLWVSKGGRLDEELTFHQRVLEATNYNDSRQNSASEVPRENGLGGGYQVVIQTPEYDDQNVLAMEPLLKHVDIMREIAEIAVEIDGVQWKLADLCFKPAQPDLTSPFAQKYASLIDRIVPCIWITPIDCFWEGGKALGPHPAIPAEEVGLVSAMLDGIPSGKPLSWENLEPSSLVKSLSDIFQLGQYTLMFQRAGIGKGYLDRPCMNPLDPHCPKLSPNYYETCDSGRVDRWDAYMKEKGLEYELDRKEEVRVDFNINSIISWLDIGRKKRSPISLTTFDEMNNSTVGEILTTTSSDEKIVTKEVKESFADLTTPQPKEPTKPPQSRKEFCRERHVPMLRWLNEHKGEFDKIFPDQKDKPTYPDYAKVMSKGCGGFARGVLQWPADMIMGATKWNKTAYGSPDGKEEDILMSANALQSVFLVASPNDIYLRFKNKPSQEYNPKMGLNYTEWSVDKAEEVIIAWQRNFTQTLYKHRHNFVSKDGIEQERRTIHPLASTSIADMLEEFCQFNYTIIVVGYGLMLLYAMLTQLRVDCCLPAAHSCAGLAFAGVLTVTFASISGLGLATWFGIEFNAATTQIVPFLTLGIGVDNMFMLLHNYHDVVQMTAHHEMGVLLRETGMSILCTSINNILSFLAGTMLPIPALRSFCAQSTILLTFNFVSILTIYPAVMSLDLIRRKAKRRDLLVCLFSPPSEEKYSSFVAKPVVQEKKTIGDESASYRNLISKQVKEVDEEVAGPRHIPHGLDEVVPYTLHAALRNYYIPLIANNAVKAVVIATSAVLIIFAVTGMQQATIGLELSDVLPEHTAPAAFLRARDAYFSFYPMFAVLKGPHIDYAKHQHLIENYRSAIGSSRFVIKRSDGRPSEEYWLGMMRNWLQNIQAKTDEAISKGIIDVRTGEVNGSEPGQRGELSGISEDALTGYRLLCSKGTKYICKGRVGHVRLVDESGTINQDGFYNYLTAWYNQDNMMYYVTQASFFPVPPSWKLKDLDLLVPAAEPLSYSQIPFYLTGLTNTPVIVEVIKELRTICDNFTAQGLPNFPQGIAFTFWEQYLHLNGNLIQAIAIIALAVFIVLSVLLFNPWAAASILAILVTMTVQLAGFLGWAGVKMNPVSAVTLITAVGIGVEFTAHVVLAFLTSLGTRQQRMASAVDRVFVPVIHGALSTLLGILMLAFSEFEFVVKYFFVVMSALIVIGLINGLILLPVLLSLIGPPTEVHPVDNKRRLPLPPPLRRRRQPPSNALPLEDDDDVMGLTMVARSTA